MNSSSKKILHGPGAVDLPHTKIEFLEFSDVVGCDTKIVKWGSSSVKRLKEAACKTFRNLVMRLKKFIKNGNKEPAEESLRRQCVFNSVI